MEKNNLEKTPPALMLAGAKISLCTRAGPCCDSPPWGTWVPLGRE